MATCLTPTGESRWHCHLKMTNETHESRQIVPLHIFMQCKHFFFHRIREVSVPGNICTETVVSYSIPEICNHILELPPPRWRTPTSGYHISALRRLWYSPPLLWDHGFRIPPTILSLKVFTFQKLQADFGGATEPYLHNPGQSVKPCLVFTDRL